MDANQTNQNPNPFSYWVVPNKFLAGDYPGTHYSYNPLTTLISCTHTIVGLHKTKYHYFHTSKQRHQSIINANIKHIIDLTETNERFLYFDKLDRLGANHNMIIQHHRFPITDRNVPSKSFMQTILNFIDDKIKKNQPIYLHCFRGLGRTGLVVGCYLARHGYSGDEALLLLNNLRNNTASKFRASPQNQKQRDMVINWKD